MFTDVDVRSGFYLGGRVCADSLLKRVLVFKYSTKYLMYSRIWRLKKTIPTKWQIRAKVSLYILYI